MATEKKQVDMSATRAGELTQTMSELQYTLPDSNEIKKQILKMDDEQTTLYNAVFDL